MLTSHAHETKLKHKSHIAKNGPLLPDILFLDECYARAADAWVPSFIKWPC